MKKTAWLITHDTTIDRRIYFFADVLREHGYYVTLFGGFKQEIDDEVTPDYVSRPVRNTLVREYSLTPEILLDHEKTLLAEAIRTADEQYQRTGAYQSAHIAQLDAFECWLQAFSGYYSVLIENKAALRSVRYNSLSGLCNLCRDLPTAVASQTAACAAVQAKMDATITAGKLQIRMSRNQMKETEVLVHELGMSRKWLCAVEAQRVYLQTCLDYRPMDEPDELGGKTFDFRDFRRYVYDYSPILENVKLHLEGEKPDIVYVADLPTLPIGYMLKEAAGAKLIMDCHEWWYKQAVLWNSENPKNIEYSEIYEAKLYPECDLTITVGDYLAADMAKEYGCPFETIYSCMSADLGADGILHEKDFWETRLGIPEGSKIAIFQGSLTSLRNLDNMMRATKYLKDGQYLVIVGDGPERSVMERVLKSEGNPDRVAFTGWVQQQKLLEYTVHADLGVLPYSPMDTYFSYSVPNKLMEFFEAGLPILFDDKMNEIRMVAGGNHVGVGADLSDPELFGRTMAELLDDTSRLDEIKANYSMCKGKFRYPAQKIRFETMLEEYHVL